MSITYKLHNPHVTYQPNMWTIIRGRSVQHPRGSSDSMLKYNEPNSISKNALRDEGCSWLINCTTQEYLVNVGLDSHFNKNKNLILGNLQHSYLRPWLHQSIKQAGWLNHIGNLGNGLRASPTET